MIQVNRIYLIFNRLVTKKFLVDTSESWYQDTIKMHKLKWNKMLPMKIEGFELGEKEMRKQEEYTFSVFLRKLLKAGYPEAKVVLKDFLAYPYSWKHLQHCIKYVYKYLVS